MNTICDTCGKTYSSGVQPDMFSGKRRCLACIGNTRITVMLEVLPNEKIESDEYAWSKLNWREQDLLRSFRSQWKRKGTLSEKQLIVLEQIYKKQRG